MTSSTETARPAREPVWGTGETRSACCPVCAAQGDKRVLLTCRSVVERDRTLTFLSCDGCGSAFVENYRDPDYSRYWIEEEGLRFYVGQGAGVDILIRVPQCFRRESGLRYCEVGCGFGFSVDYAGLMNGWAAIGVDPSPMAAHGRRMLGLDIVPDYLPIGPSPLGTFDLLMASEVIEHIAAPGPFLAALRAHLAPGGVLVLSTPSARVLASEYGAGIVIPALSPGYHAVVYSADGLRRILLAAGFPHVEVRERDATLVAVAADRPVAEEPWLPPEPDDAEAYFRARIALEEQGSLVDVGLRTRLYRSLVNRAAFAEARPVFEDLRRSVSIAHEFDPADPRDVEARLAGVSPGDFVGLMRNCPAGLASVLYAHGIACHLGQGERERACRFLALAGRAAVLLREALNANGADDGDAQTIGWSAEEARLHVLAFDDPAATAEGLIALRRTPVTAGYRFDTQQIVDRTSMHLYNHLLCLPGAEAAVSTLRAAGVA